MNKQLMTVFISHSSKDRKAALSLCRELESLGHSCWISSRDIRPGENFQEAIVSAIRSSAVFLLTLSSAANDSEEVKKELALASQAKLAVIPIRVEDMLPSGALAYELATRQWIDFFANWGDAVHELHQRLNILLREPEIAFVGSDGVAVSKSVAKSEDDEWPNIIREDAIQKVVSSRLATIGERSPRRKPNSPDRWKPLFAAAWVVLAIAFIMFFLWLKQSPP